LPHLSVVVLQFVLAIEEGARPRVKARTDPMIKSKRFIIEPS